MFFDRRAALRAALRDLSCAKERRGRPGRRFLFFGAVRSLPEDCWAACRWGRVLVEGVDDRGEVMSVSVRVHKLPNWWSARVPASASKGRRDLTRSQRDRRQERAQNVIGGEQRNARAGHDVSG